MELYAKIKELRSVMGLNQIEFSKLLCLSQGALSNCETGRRGLSISKCYKLIKIAKLHNIDMTIEYLRPDK